MASTSRAVPALGDGTAHGSRVGQTAGSSGSSDSPYMYAGTWGYRTEGDAGLMLVGACYYDTQVGRFITRDTVLSEHPYLYCEHDAVNWVDPSGHASWWDRFVWTVRLVVALVLQTKEPRPPAPPPPSPPGIGRMIGKGGGGGSGGGVAAIATMGVGSGVFAKGMQAVVAYRKRFRGLLGGDSAERHWRIDEDCDLGY